MQQAIDHKIHCFGEANQFSGNGAPVASDLRGVITKEHVADSIVISLRSYTSIDGKL
jgi:hypothetical protein